MNKPLPAHLQHHAKKRFGQNFLCDDKIIQQIVNHIQPTEQDNLVEIGPGLGALTAAILPLTKKINVVELDRDIIPKLKANCMTLGELIVHSVDALKFNFAELAQEDQKIRVIGNLPYNISTPLLFHLFNYAEQIQDMHFMLQYEVVKRLAAQPGSKAYGRLGIMAQIHCQIEHCFDVPSEAFSPPPKVTSAIVKLVPHAKPVYKIKHHDLFQKIVTSAFGQRRKTIRKSLANWLDKQHFAELAIDDNARAEVLSIEDFVKISNFVATQKLDTDN